MKTITLLTVAIVLLLQFIGAVPNSSVGGPLTEMFIVFLAMLAVGIHEAWVNKRGVFGWIVSIVASVVGGLVAVSFGSTLMEMMLSPLHLQGSLVSSHRTILYISEAAMAIITVFGSWTALQVVDRLRSSFAKVVQLDN